MSNKKNILITILLGVVFFGITGGVWAQNFQYNLMVPIPQPNAPTATTTTGIADYIRTLYLFALLLGGILAFGVLVFAGFLWLTSGGAGGQISRAKGMITNALLGLALLATSYIILNTINPTLVRLREPVISTNIAFTNYPGAGPGDVPGVDCNGINHCEDYDDWGRIVWCWGFHSGQCCKPIVKRADLGKKACELDVCGTGEECSWSHGYAWCGLPFGDGERIECSRQ